jgi:hypothetical protein
MSPCTKSGRDATRRRTGENPGAEQDAPTAQWDTKIGALQGIGGGKRRANKPGMGFRQS